MPPSVVPATKTQFLILTLSYPKVLFTPYPKVVVAYFTVNPSQFKVILLALMLKQVLVERTSAVKVRSAATSPQAVPLAMSCTPNSAEVPRFSVINEDSELEVVGVRVKEVSVKSGVELPERLLLESLIKVTFSTITSIPNSAPVKLFCPKENHLVMKLLWLKCKPTPTKPKTKSINKSKNIPRSVESENRAKKTSTFSQKPLFLLIITSLSP